MENWSPTIVFELGYSAHLEKVALAGDVRARTETTARGPTPRDILALALIALAARIAPAQFAIPR